MDAQLCQPSVSPATASTSANGKTIKIATHASEGGTHWYDRQGRPVYEVPSADGKKFVEPDVRHARKLGLVPGVSGIINCAEKPALTIWKIEQSIMASLTLTRRPHEPDVEFIRRIIEDSQQQAKNAADRGTAIHTAIESYYEDRPFAGEFAPHVDAVAQAVQAKYGIERAAWHAERTFACPLGFGGKTDLHSPLLKPRILLDFKSKEFKEAPSKENRVKLAWDENCIQLAAYRHGLGAPAAVCANVYVSRDVPGLVHIHEWTEDDLARGWNMFLSLLAYWQHQRRYFSGWIA